MMTSLEYLQEINVVSVCLRLLLALLMGGAIGLQRESSRRPAGFRTHILVCMGAALAMLTNQYMCDIWTTQVDPARIGAQVVTGVGFLGAGTIIMTRPNHIKGLTTAAGLWASACLGLAIGIGFYLGAIVATLLILISLSWLSKLGEILYVRSGKLELYAEVEGLDAFRAMMTLLKDEKVSVEDTNFLKGTGLTEHGVGISLALRLPKGMTAAHLIDKLATIGGVDLIEEQ